MPLPRWSGRPSPPCAAPCPWSAASSASPPPTPLWHTSYSSIHCAWWPRSTLGSAPTRCAACASCRCADSSAKLHGDADGHHHVQVVAAAEGTHDSRAQRTVEAHLHLVGVDHRQGVEHVSRVERDLYVGAVDLGGHRGLVIPDLGGLRAQRERVRAGAEAHHVR